MGKIICRIKVARKFKDLQLGRSVSVGEVYEVTKDRADQLVGLGFVQVVEIYTPEKSEKPVTEVISEADAPHMHQKPVKDVAKSTSRRGGRRISKKK